MRALVKAKTTLCISDESPCTPNACFGRSIAARAALCAKLAHVGIAKGEAQPSVHAACVKTFLSTQSECVCKSVDGNGVPSPGREGNSTSATSPASPRPTAAKAARACSLCGKGKNCDGTRASGRGKRFEVYHLLYGSNVPYSKACEEDKTNCAKICTQLKIVRDRCVVSGPGDAGGLLPIVPPAQRHMLHAATQLSLSSSVCSVTPECEFNNVTGGEFHYHKSCLATLEKVASEATATDARSAGDALVEHQQMVDVTDWCLGQVRRTEIISWATVHEEILSRVDAAAAGESSLRRTTRARQKFAKYWLKTLTSNPLVVVTEAGRHYVMTESSSLTPFRVITDMAAAERQKRLYSDMVRALFCNTFAHLHIVYLFIWKSTPGGKASRWILDLNVA